MAALGILVFIGKICVLPCIVWGWCQKIVKASVKAKAKDKAWTFDSRAIKFGLKADLEAWTASLCEIVSYVREHATA